ncbi:MAG: M23 family metallopeptidase [Candidatus Woesearchaeota archaeon]
MRHNIVKVLLLCFILFSIFSVRSIQEKTLQVSNNLYLDLSYFESIKTEAEACFNQFKFDKYKIVFEITLDRTESTILNYGDLDAPIVFQGYFEYRKDPNNNELKSSSKVFILSYSRSEILKEPEKLSQVKKCLIDKLSKKDKSINKIYSVMDSEKAMYYHLFILQKTGRKNVDLCLNLDENEFNNLKKTIDEFLKTYNLQIKIDLKKGESENCYSSFSEGIQDIFKSINKNMYFNNRNVILITQNLYSHEIFDLKKFAYYLSNNPDTVFFLISQEEYEKDYRDIVKTTYVLNGMNKSVVVLAFGNENKFLDVIFDVSNRFLLLSSIILQFSSEVNFSKVTLAFELLEKSRAPGNWDFSSGSEKYDVLSLKYDTSIFLSEKYSSLPKGIKSIFDKTIKVAERFDIPLHFAERNDWRTRTYVILDSKNKKVEFNVFDRVILDMYPFPLDWNLGVKSRVTSISSAIKNLKTVEKYLKENSHNFMRMVYIPEEGCEKKEEYPLRSICDENWLNNEDNGFFRKLKIFSELNNCGINISKYYCENPQEFNIFKYIYDVSMCFEVDPRLVLGVILRESDGRHSLKDTCTGSNGLLQLTIPAVQDVDCTVFLKSEADGKMRHYDYRTHPLISIACGVKYIRKTIRDYGGGYVDHAMWAYNFGVGNLRNAIKNSLGKVDHEEFSRLSVKNKTVALIDYMVQDLYKSDNITLYNKALEVPPYALSIISYYLFLIALNIPIDSGNNFNLGLNVLDGKSVTRTVLEQDVDLIKSSYKTEDLFSVDVSDFEKAAKIPKDFLITSIFNQLEKQIFVYPQFVTESSDERVELNLKNDANVPYQVKKNFYTFQGTKDYSICKHIEKYLYVYEILSRTTQQLSIDKSNTPINFCHVYVKLKDLPEDSWVFPVGFGRLTGKFDDVLSDKSKLNAINIAPLQSLKTYAIVPILAAHDGYVTFVGKERKGGRDYSNVIELVTKDGKYKTVYKYLSRVFVIKNTEVKKGEVIGIMGFGPTRTSILRFEVKALDGKEEFIDPLSFNYYGVEGEIKSNISKCDTNSKVEDLRCLFDLSYIK